MKRKYQIPEVQIFEMKVSKCFLQEESGKIGNDGVLNNENKTFEEDIPTGTSQSLWD
jgi:hypothetical protein